MKNILTNFFSGNVTQEAKDLQDKQQQETKDLQAKHLQETKDLQAKKNPNATEKEFNDLQAKHLQEIKDLQAKLLQEVKDLQAKKDQEAKDIQAKKDQEAKKGEKIEFLVLHCSASNLPKHDNIATIDRWHKARGWKGVGYHYFIQSDGTLEIGRPLNDDPIIERKEVGAHTLGINRRSIGVCLSGIDATDFTLAQFNTLSKLINDLQEKGIDFKIAGHNYFTDKKSCPNFDWRKWVKKNFEKLLPE